MNESERERLAAAGENWPRGDSCRARFVRVIKPPRRGRAVNSGQTALNRLNPLIKVVILESVPTLARPRRYISGAGESRASPTPRRRWLYRCASSRDTGGPGVHEVVGPETPGARLARKWREKREKICGTPKVVF